MIGTFFGTFFSNFGTVIKTISTASGSTLPAGLVKPKKFTHTESVEHARRAKKTAFKKVQEMAKAGLKIAFGDPPPRPCQNESNARMFRLFQFFRFRKRRRSTFILEMVVYSRESSQGR